MATLKDLIAAVSQQRSSGEDDYFGRRFAELDNPGPEYELAKAIAMAHMENDSTTHKLRTAAQLRREENEYERAHPAPISEFQRAQLEHSKRAFDLDSRKTDAEIRNMDWNADQKRQAADPNAIGQKELAARSALENVQMRSDPEGSGIDHFKNRIGNLFRSKGDGFDMSKVSPELETIIGDVDRKLSGTAPPEKLAAIKARLRDYAADTIGKIQEAGSGRGPRKRNEQDYYQKYGQLYPIDNLRGGTGIETKGEEFSGDGKKPPFVIEHMIPEEADRRNAEYRKGRIFGVFR